MTPATEGSLFLSLFVLGVAPAEVAKMLAMNEDYNEGELLTGAKVYLHLLQKNEEQLRTVQEKLQEYTALQSTLRAVTDQSRRRLMAPVAGGLAYFDAEMVSTNNITVLLGDGWFAERSASQAAEIAGRRIDFLRRELEVLRQESASLVAKQELFLSELPEAHEAMMNALESDARRSGGLHHSATLPSQTAYSVPSASSPSTVVPTATNGGRMSGDGGNNSTTTNNNNNTHDPFDGLRNVDAALATFDELDELTADELIAIEKELGDQVEDDELVERVITERMIAKKERRVREELKKQEMLRAASADSKKQPNALKEVVDISQLATRENVTPAPKPVIHSKPSSNNDGAMPASVAPSNAKFHTPGDIGLATDITDIHSSIPICMRSRTVEGSETTVIEAETSHSENASSLVLQPAEKVSDRKLLPPTNKKPKKVSFDPSVVGGLSRGRAASATDWADSTASPLPLPSSRHASGTGEVEQPPLRATYHIGDIVERSGPVGVPDLAFTTSIISSTSIGSSATALSVPVKKPKRKSLFQRELEEGGSA